MIDNKYTIIRELGSGATSKVYLVQDNNTQEQLAVKVMKNTDSTQISQKVLDDVKREVTIGFDLKHENIIQVRAIGRGLIDKNKGEPPREVVYIVMEFAEEGELFDTICNTGKFSEPLARYYFQQILNTLDYLHNKEGICHRDLKPENILLDKNFNIKFTDFGFAVPIAGKNYNGKLNSFKGTLGYMPPE